MGTNITIDTLCSMMDNNGSGPPLQRYADVNSLMLTTYQQKCQDFSYQSMVDDLKKVDWKSDAAEGGTWWLLVVVVVVVGCGGGSGEVGDGGGVWWMT